MNFFAHLVLAQPTVHSRVGNLLGDFARGIDTQSLSPEIYQGLVNHRRVDHFTDQHPTVRELKTCFSPQRRRFAGIALDVLFDHYLLLHWERFSEVPKQSFIRELYRDLDNGQSLMPERMQLVTRRITAQDWFSSYEELEGVAYALDRIASRIRFKHQFAGVGEELEQNYRVFEQGFEIFFPDLISEFGSPVIKTPEA